MNRSLSIARGLCVALAIAAFLAPARAQGQAATITVHDAWVREAPKGRTVTAAFMVIENAGATPRSVTKAAATEIAETLELHEMKRDGASMSMSPVKSIDVPAKGKVELMPGGLHVMMFGVKRPLTAGDELTITLTLDDGSAVKVPAKVRGMQGMRP